MIVGKNQNQFCQSCKSMAGTTCKKNKQEVALGDWCRAWKLATDYESTYQLTTDETAQLARMVNEYGYAKSSEWIIEEMIRAHGCEKAWQMLESERDDLANPELF